MKKTYIAILSLMALAACQEPVNYLEQAQAFFEADETMELTASATKIDLDRDNLDAVALTFEWTSARDMPEDYIPTYITKIDIYNRRNEMYKSVKRNVQKFIFSPLSKSRSNAA